MAENLIGGNTDDMDTLGARFHSQANAVDDLLASLSRDVDGTWWKGGAADRFRSDWETDFQPALKRLSAALVQAGDSVKSTSAGFRQVGN